MYFKKILVPFDNSKFSKNAANVAMMLAQKFNSKLLFLTCLDNDLISGPMYIDESISKKEYEKKFDDAKNRLKLLKQQADKQGISTNVKISQTANVVKKITDSVKQNKIDLVIMGSRGRTGFDKLFFGSKSEGTLHNVDCPVLIIK